MKVSRRGPEGKSQREEPTDVRMFYYQIDHESRKTKLPIQRCILGTFLALETIELLLVRLPLGSYVFCTFFPVVQTWFQARGQKYWTMSKWGLGGLLVALLVIVIWFPLLFMSYINSVYTSNLPQDATFTLSIGGYQVGTARRKWFNGITRKKWMYYVKN